MMSTWFMPLCQHHKGTTGTAPEQTHLGSLLLLLLFLLGLLHGIGLEDGEPRVGGQGPDLGRKSARIGHVGGGSTHPLTFAPDSEDRLRR